MIERKSVQVPLSCFGHEHDSEDVMCQKCPHERDCIKASGIRGNRITLDRLDFRMIPNTDMYPKHGLLEDSEEADIRGVFEACHRTVFGRKTIRGVHRLPDFKDQIVSGATKARCPISLYCLTIMLAHKRLNPDREFFPSFLISDTAIQRVGRYRDAAIEEYGAFDLSHLNLLTKSDNTSLRNNMLHSEIAAGTWIIGWKIRHKGDALTEFYAQNELSLDPLWLATESTYMETVYKPHIKTPNGTKEIQRHRFRVSKVLQQLGRGTKGTRHIEHLFLVRRWIMADAIKSSLRYYGFQPQDFEAENKPVLDCMKLWRRIALAIQHWYCLQHFEGVPNALKNLVL